MITEDKKVILDFETYSPVSLSDYGAPLYCRHPDFKICIGWFLDENGYHFSEGHDRTIKKVLSYKKSGYKLLAHNAAFEWQCTQGQTEPDDWLCTSFYSSYYIGLHHLAAAAKALKLPLAKTPGGKWLCTTWTIEKGGDIKKMKADIENWNTYKEYCKTDVALTKMLWDKLQSMAPYPPLKEQKYFQDTWKLKDNKIPLDGELIDKMNEVMDSYRKIVDKILKEKYEGVNIKSFIEVARFVEKRWGVAIKAMGQEYIAKLNLPHECRRFFNLKESYPTGTLKRIEKLKGLKDFQLDLMHFGTYTGKYVHTGVSFLTLPRGAGKADIGEFKLTPTDLLIQKYGVKTMPLIKNCMKAMIRAPKGWDVWWADYKQIDFKILMHICKHAEPKDIHSLFGYYLFGKNIQKGDPERLVAKECVHGIAYGLGPKALQEKLKTYMPDIKEGAAEAAIELYYKFFPNVKKLKDYLWKNFDKRKFKLLNGRTLYFPKYKFKGMDIEERTFHKGGILGSFIGANTRELVFQKQNELLKYNHYIYTNLHDEFLGKIRKQHVEYDIIRLLQEAPEWLPVDLEVDFGRGAYYGK